MALPLYSLFACSLPHSLPKLLPLRDRCHAMHVMCVTRNQTREPPATILRRSANYQPNIWEYNFIQSVQSEYWGEPYASRVEELNMEAKHLLEATIEPSARLELIDTLQRLGLGFHFEKEIRSALETICVDAMSSADLYTTALLFRLLRQLGYKVSPDVFTSFMDENRSFKADLCGDIKGLLSLYEASELGFEGENIIDEAKAFSSGHLKVATRQVDPILAQKVGHSLELPLHRRMLRLEARWFIDAYEKEEGMNPTLLELAKLDFNMIQAIYQGELRVCSRWWKERGLRDKLTFVRDRLMENFFWALGVTFYPQFSECREGLTKVVSFITTIDDIYDVYGSMDELVLFTDVVDRWDLKAMEQLPEYMKICFLALYNTVNEMAYDTLKERGLDSIQYLKKSWADLCKSFLLEAKWYHNGYMPTLDGYLNNAWVSVSGPLQLVNAFFLIGEEVTEESLQCLEKYPNIIRWSSMIFRLCNDLETSKVEQEIGDVPTSIQCYMNQAGVSEEIAREHIKDLISNTWKKLNEECVNSSAFSRPFINACVDLPRMAQCMYQYGDGYSCSDKETKDQTMRLLIEPIRSTH